jgi:SAM-dependent methyltransferase
MARTLKHTALEGLPAAGVYQVDGRPGPRDGVGVVPRGGLCQNRLTGGLFINMGTLTKPQWTKMRDATVALAERKPDVVWVPTPSDIVVKMLELAGVTGDDVLYDMGCGDGRMVAAAAKTYGCKAVGVDINPRRIAAARATVRKEGVAKLAEIRQQDIYKVDLSEATVVTLYLLRNMNTKLIPQFEKMRPGSRIVAHDYGMDGVEPDKVIEAHSGKDKKLHRLVLWTIPFTRSRAIRKRAQKG